MSRIISVIRFNFSEAVSSLRAARLRTLLGLIGIMIGISSVIAMISLGEIAKQQARKQFQSMGTNVLVVRKSSDSFTSQERDAQIKQVDAINLPTVATITEAAARISLYGQTRFAGKDLGQGSIQGVTQSFASVNKLTVAEGRFISDLDIGQSFCVVGGELAEAMRKSGAREIIGALVELDENVFTVIGVLAPAEENYALPVYIDANKSVFIPMSMAQRFDANAEIEFIIARSQPDAHYELVTEEVSSYFHGKDPSLKLDIVTAKQLIAQMESQTQLFTLLLAAVGSISLIVGGIGIMNIMLVSVAERRQEIAIRRAIGARRGDIQSQFLIESIILTLMGGILGIGLGLAATFGICQFTRWEFAVSYLSVFSGLGTAALAGIFFGFQPARQAARLDPIAGLQSGA